MKAVQYSGTIHQPVTIFELDIHQPADWLEIQVYFRIKKWQHLFLWDPNGRLRWQYVHVHAPKTAVIHKNEKLSDYGTLPGALPLGTWKLEVLILPEHLPVQHKLNITAGTGLCSSSGEWSNDQKQYWANADGKAPMQANLYPMTKAKKCGPAWYRGDFHTHTAMSDGKMTVKEGMVQARKQKLDFFAATDHNLLPTMWVEDEKVLVIPGMEVTSSKGHFNALGLTSWVDWRPTHPDGGMESEQGMNRVVSEIKKAGALFSINHPRLAASSWLFNDTSLSDIDSFEVWNDPTFPKNLQATEEALLLWNELWNAGYCVCGIGGSDCHGLPTESYEPNGLPSVIGDPATYVYSSELSARAILQSVKERRVYVTRGPIIDQTVEINHETFMIGEDVSDLIHRMEEAVVRFKVKVDPVPGGKLLWIENGKVIDEQLMDGSSEYESCAQWKSGEFVWRRLEIRSDTGNLLAFTNPVFSGTKPPEIDTWGQLLAKAGLV
ncbi:CehA/McbA family metallohydrolase [Bacillus xiapuensis]|uniref:CehA/McbA family metallohydrolase n=1 Tax=Bacillus xiapuensis TaxID=2014075 RepID=UPI000C2463FC|nr:CehA/McbA family metallohydrolase [Bacillus xiapuensis]